MLPLEDEAAQPLIPFSTASTGQGPGRSRVGRLFEEFAPAVRAFLLRRLGNIEDAREGAQEIFLSLWRREQQGQLLDEARAYLFTAADNWAKDHRRKARTHVAHRHEPMDEAHHRLLASEPGGDEVVHWRRGLEMLVSSIRELPPDTQRIFDLYHGGQMTYTEIARELGITTRTVERHMAQAIAHCKVRLRAYL